MHVLFPIYISRDWQPHFHEITQKLSKKISVSATSSIERKHQIPLPISPPPPSPLNFSNLFSRLSFPFFVIESIAMTGIEMTIVVIHRELPVTVLAPVLGARRGQPLPADLAVHPRPEPRLHVTAARCTVLTTATGTLLLAPAVDEAAQRRRERRLHPATSNTQAREEALEKGDERGELQRDQSRVRADVDGGGATGQDRQVSRWNNSITARTRGRKMKRYRVSRHPLPPSPEAQRLYSRAEKKRKKLSIRERSSERGEERDS